MSSSVILVLCYDAFCSAGAVFELAGCGSVGIAVVCIERSDSNRESLDGGDRDRDRFSLVIFPVDEDS